MYRKTVANLIAALMGAALALFMHLLFPKIAFVWVPGAVMSLLYLYLAMGKAKDRS